LRNNKDILLFKEEEKNFEVITKSYQKIKLMIKFKNKQTNDQAHSDEWSNRSWFHQEVGGRALDYETYVVENKISTLFIK